jgi:hypothetical protein
MWLGFSFELESASPTPDMKSRRAVAAWFSLNGDNARVIATAKAGPGYSSPRKEALATALWKARQCPLHRCPEPEVLAVASETDLQLLAAAKTPKKFLLVVDPRAAEAEELFRQQFEDELAPKAPPLDAVLPVPGHGRICEDLARRFLGALLACYKANPLRLLDKGIVCVTLPDGTRWFPVPAGGLLRRDVLIYRNAEDLRAARQGNFVFLMPGEEAPPGREVYGFRYELPQDCSPETRSYLERHCPAWAREKRMPVAFHDSAQDQALDLSAKEFETLGQIAAALAGFKAACSKQRIWPPRKSISIAIPLPSGQPSCVAEVRFRPSG